MKMNMKYKAVYELPLCLTREQVTHLQKRNIFVCKKEKFCFSSLSLFSNHGKAAANVNKYIYIYTLPHS